MMSSHHTITTSNRGRQNATTGSPEAVGGASMFNPFWARHCVTPASSLRMRQVALAGCSPSIDHQGSASSVVGRAGLTSLRSASGPVPPSGAPPGTFVERLRAARGSGFTPRPSRDSAKTSVSSPNRALGAYGLSPGLYRDFTRLGGDQLSSQSSTRPVLWSRIRPRGSCRVGSISGVPPSVESDLGQMAQAGSGSGGAIRRARWALNASGYVS
mmetsp:Transcript_65858/g.182512  ORF Transcript_65858/g.182512 Transcript_65858/m.182512 type:complete len:214 (-) Transcript_65858:936-1577(-)